MSFLFLFPVVFNNFFTVPIEIENERLTFALAVPTGTPITVANDAIEILPLVADKKLKIYQNSQRKQYIYLAICLLILFL